MGFMQHSYFILNWFCGKIWPRHILAIDFVKIKCLYISICKCMTKNKWKRRLWLVHFKNSISQRLQMKRFSVVNVLRVYRNVQLHAMGVSAITLTSAGSYLEAVWQLGAKSTLCTAYIDIQTRAMAWTVLLCAASWRMGLICVWVGVGPVGVGVSE